jgi:hypothetical protein
MGVNRYPEKKAASLDSSGKLMRSQARKPDNVAGSSLTVFNGDVGTGAITSTTSTTPLKKYSITILTPGTYRITFYLKSTNSTNTVYGQIYRNGVAVGTQRSNANNSTNGLAYTEDIAGWNEGDVLEIYLWSTDTTATYAAALQDIYIYVAGDVANPTVH